jgi:hypothetical protein
MYAGLIPGRVHQHDDRIDDGRFYRRAGSAARALAVLELKKWAVVCTTLLGRLEAFTLLVLFTPAFGRR